MVYYIFNVFLKVTEKYSWLIKTYLYNLDKYFLRFCCLPPTSFFPLKY